MSTRPLTSCLALLAFGVLSCGKGAPSRDDHPEGSPTSPRPVPTTSAATQLDLAHELDATDHAEDHAAAMTALRGRWEGRRLTWKVTRQAALCRTAAACNVVPFPVPRPRDTDGHGWLPALEFAPGQFDRLLAICGGTPTCELTFEGDLSQLALSDELPTSLRFTNVSIVTATASM